jgi:deoxyhypusine synthase
MSYSSYVPADYIATQDRNYLKFRNEELNKELLSRIGEIQQSQEKIKSLENIVATLQKTIQGYHEKLASSEKLKVDINLRCRRINELEEEINLQKAENM